jgi:hypothetical protein
MSMNTIPYFSAATYLWKLCMNAIIVLEVSYSKCSPSANIFECSTNHSFYCPQPPRFCSEDHKSFCRRQLADSTFPRLDPQHSRSSPTEIGTEELLVDSSSVNLVGRDGVHVWPTSKSWPGLTRKPRKPSTFPGQVRLGVGRWSFSKIETDEGCTALSARSSIPPKARRTLRIVSPCVSSVVSRGDFSPFSSGTTDQCVFLASKLVPIIRYNFLRYWPGVVRMFSLFQRLRIFLRIVSPSGNQCYKSYLYA